MTIPFFDLKKLYFTEKNQIEGIVRSTLESGWYILGEEVKKFEKSCTEFLNPPSNGEVIGCNSGTDAIVLSLLAEGIGTGDEVITVAHTAPPTVTAICSTGATPVFVDIDPHSWVMNPANLEAALTPKTKAIVPVHLYGNAVDIERIKSQIPNIPIIEDTAQAFGTRLKGRFVGTGGTYGAFSFYPTKNLGALGDAGAVFTDPERASRIRDLRNYGQKNRYEISLSRGINSRLDELQAAVLGQKLSLVSDYNEKKAAQVEKYKDGLGSLPIQFQKMTPDSNPAWHLFVIALEDQNTRDALIEALKASGIQTHIHYPVPNHRQDAFKAFSKGTLPVTEKLVDRIVSLPMNPVLSEEEQDFVIQEVRRFFG